MKKLLLGLMVSLSILDAGRYPFENDILNIPDATEFAPGIGA